MKRVAILLVKNFGEAIRQRSVRAADSEPYWLNPDQYSEHDGGVEVNPAKAGDLIDYAERNDLRPLGLVVVNEDDSYCQYLNEGPIPPEHRAFALKVLRWHVHFWFWLLPFLSDGQADN